MGQEAATYIDGLNASWPLSTDLIRYGAVHLRTVKGAIKATFPSLTGAVTLSHTQINDAARQSIRNTFSQTTTGVVAPIQLESIQPGMLYKETDGGTDAKIWRTVVNSEQLNEQILSDDGNTIANYRQILRSGTTVAQINYLATLLKLTGKLETTSSIELGHASDTTLARSSAGLAMVESEVLGFRRPVPNPITGNYNLVLADAGKGITYTGAGGHDITLPSNASQPFAENTGIIIANNSSSDLEINSISDDIFYAGSSAADPFDLAPNGLCLLYKVGTTKWFIIGLGVS